MMSETNLKPRSVAFKIGWGILLFFSIGNVLGHIGLSIFESEPTTIFVAWAGMNFLAAGILLIPYRRGEKWAWSIVWALIVPYALVILFNQDVGPTYLGEAGLMALGQLLTYRTVFGKE
jgi:hypothetical protein